MKSLLSLLFLSSVAFSCKAMDLPMENASTNQALAKYSGCFVAVKDTYLKGYSLISDASLAFAYVHPGDATAKNFIGYLLSVLQIRMEEKNMPCPFPRGLCAKPELYLRMATNAELAIAKEKIKNNELQLGHGISGEHALEFLQSAANVNPAPKITREKRVLN